MSLLGNLGSKNLDNIAKEYGDGNSPFIDIKISGKKWDSKRFLPSKANVNTSIWGEAGTCSVEIVDSFDNSAKSKFSSDFNFEDLKIGKKLEVFLGGTRNNHAEADIVFEGYIYAYDINISNERTTIVIQGMDAKMWMMSNRKSRKIISAKTSTDAVSTICREDYSSQISIEKIKVDNEITITDSSIIYQGNESDYAYICRIAKTIGALFFIDRGDLYFINPLKLKAIKLTISALSKNVISLTGTMDIGGTPKSIKFVAIDKKDFKKRKEINVKKPEKMGTGTQASSAVKNTSNGNIIEIQDIDIANATKNAKSLAQALMTIMGLNFFKVIIEIAGDPKTKLGTGVELVDIGEPFKSGDYIVTGIEHIVDSSKYVTKLTLNTTTVKMKN